MAKSKFRQITSARGEALYPHLKEPETWEGKPTGYSIQVKYSKEDTDKLIGILEQELKAAKQSEEFAKKTWLKEPSMGYRETPDGDIIFKFKTKHEIETKAGEIIKKVVPVFDSKGKPIDVNIGNGSTVRISFLVVPFHTSAKNNGVTLYLNAVQVINLVEYKGANAESYGFQEEDGFDSEADSSFDSEDSEEITADTPEDF